ncbi:LEF-8 [Chrysodeixis chalcites nucleopolyhedrovirus]|uniref:DNA-directed RNA polymerase n=1 Tax=Chrysodeixis chalcites nucleopolyhedrovirus TaxID=320432 RepID=Q4KT43_9ABAC|nr:LEF-8 [Chrysodeixis chalcites nucleopolyhedrovirus]AAY83968.1 LEF-8 [Chrysodeixis chalcites nucleopolyhedrovirus]AGE61299.1 LEF-8 [Chrysodeixis chalcites nucleopolyhedrovirus]AGE61597.1 LEF-8 [Chrysodeixis chalcites nucleopolyhedrovirus]AGE61747.1 LEF-8 [Chrysodeixis chalcites nucleopolyhedrovirus]
MTDVIVDFNNLYDKLKNKYNFEFYLNCNNKSENECTVKYLQERRSYFCCAVDVQGRCVLHKCVLVIFGTRLDLKFRHKDTYKINNMNGTFMIDGRNLSFPNILMNNNILLHNFYDKQYSKNCKRMFLYGNVDKEKKINRAIQLVYDKDDNVLFARDVFARDYIVTMELNEALEMYLKRSGKWEPLNFIFDFNTDQSNHLVEDIKNIMKSDINYTIDSLANKIIYKHDYLLDLMYAPILKEYTNMMKIDDKNCVNVSDDDNDSIARQESKDEKQKKNKVNGSGGDDDGNDLGENKSNNKRKRNNTQAFRPKNEEFIDNKNDGDINKTGSIKRRKLQTILFVKECKKVVDTIVNGKLIYSVSKTFSKQKKNFINYQDNSSNNNIEINPPPLKYRIGNEVVRITNDTMRQDMLMQQRDFVKFVDSFFHGEMTVAGKKFFLCRNVRLPAVDYQLVADKFKLLLTNGLIYANDPSNVDEKNIRIAFNDRPTIYACRFDDLQLIFYQLKRQYSPIELKLANRILFVNHHEGMVCIKRVISIAGKKITTLLTPFEYHNSYSILKKYPKIGKIEENDDVTSLMSKLVQYYYFGYTRIFSTIPVPKLIVSLTNLKNAMPVSCYDEELDSDVFLKTLPVGNSVVVSPRIQVNNKMFKLWTLVRDNKLMTAEDPYIPDINLPIRLYNNKINKLKGKLNHSKTETPVIKYFKSKENNFVQVEGGNFLYMAGVVVSNVKIGWIYDGKRYKIEACKNKNFFLSKIYIYFREIFNQRIECLDSTMAVHNDTVYVKVTMITSTSDLQGIKICGIHGQKGVMNGSEDLTEWMAEDGTSAQICLSPISFLSRQSNFNDIETKYVVRGGNHHDLEAKRYPIFNIPYMLFNNTPDNIFKEFIKSNYTGHEKVEGTRLDQWTINQSFVGNRLSESLQCVRGSSNLPDNSGEFRVMGSLLHCNNTMIR